MLIGTVVSVDRSNLNVSEEKELRMETEKNNPMPFYIT